MKPNKLIHAAIFAAMTLSACSKTRTDDVSQPESQGSRDNERATVPVKVMELQPGRYKEYSEYLGTITAIKEARLSSYGGGRVLKIFKDRGDRVRAGERLCDIEAQKYNTQYESAHLSEKLASEKVERTKQHLAQGTAARTQLDRAQLELLQATHNRLEAEKLRDGANCITPFAGVVVDKLINLYDETTPGQATFYVADLSKVRVTIGVPETEISGYKVGNQASLESKGIPGRSWQGKIISIAQKVHTDQRTFQVELEFDNTDNMLRTGMSVRVKVLRFDLKDRLVVPTSAILVLSNEKAVMLVKDSRASKQTIEIESSNESESLIQSGLEAGDLLIIQGQMQAVDGSAVTIVKEQAGS